MGLGVPSADMASTTSSSGLVSPLRVEASAICFLAPPLASLAVA